MCPPLLTMRCIAVTLAILTIALRTPLLLAQTDLDASELPPHQRQAHAPHLQLDLVIQEGVSEIVQASTQDLNVITTPFKRVKITSNAKEQFTIDNNQIYFQLQDKHPFSIYVTEDGDQSAPKYKILLVPSDLPVGQQINLVPKEPYFPRGGRSEQTVKKTHGYHQQLVNTLASVAKYLATQRKAHLPEDFRIDDDFTSTPYYIGNVLMVPEIVMRGSDYNLYVITANNRSDRPLQLTAPDFVKMTPTTGLLDNADPDEQAVALGFYPRKVIQPGQSTQVMLMRPSVLED